MRLRGIRRVRPGWPLILLLASILATGVAVVEAARLARTHGGVAERLVDDYTAIAAWSYQRHASAALHDAVVDVLRPFMHFQRHGLLHSGDATHPRWFIEHYVDESHPSYGRSGHPFPRFLPETFIGVSLKFDTIAVVGRPLGAALADAVRDVLGSHVRQVHESSWDIGMVRIAEGGESLLLAYTIMPTTTRDTAIYAIPVDAGTFGALLDEVYRTEQLLPAALTRGRRTEELLDVALVDDANEPLFESASRDHLPVHGTEPLARQYGGLRVVAAIRSDAAPQLIIGGLPASRLPFLLSLLGIAAALALVGIGQMRRETALAVMRSDFVSSVSHELRTPLAQIRLFLETLRLGRFKSRDQRDWLLQNIDRETARLTHLVDNLLLFSRLEHGRADPVPEPTELAAEIRQIVRSFEPLAASRRTHIQTALQDGLVAIVQREPFRQLLLNLLDNAVKYGPVGQTVIVRLAGADAAEPAAAPVQVARITVEDAGPGVAPAEREDVWKPFHRGSRALDGGAAGGGIGLSIVREIVQRHGGRVRIEEAPGGGAAFIVELPLERVAADAPAELLATAADPDGAAVAS